MCSNSVWLEIVENEEKRKDLQPTQQQKQPQSQQK